MNCVVPLDLLLATVPTAFFLSSEFFANKEVSSISRTVQQVTEKARSRSIWMQRDAEAVLAWLRDNAKNRLG